MINAHETKANYNKLKISSQIFDVTETGSPTGWNRACSWTDKAMSGELLIFENGSYGMAQNLESTDVGIIILGDLQTFVREILIRRTGKSWKFLWERPGC